uniref:Uncharacterized protein n=1 Tax=Bracon brevicornis TaxID=1563983 RepID=A0A6V7KNK0_9HYME
MSESLGKRQRGKLIGITENPDNKTDPNQFIAVVVHLTVSIQKPNEIIGERGLPCTDNTIDTENVKQIENKNYLMEVNNTSESEESSEEQEVGQVSQVSKGKVNTSQVSKGQVSEVSNGQVGQVSKG